MGKAKEKALKSGSTSKVPINSGGNFRHLGESVMLDGNHHSDNHKKPHNPNDLFVSTNDILVSTFGKAVDARVLLMPINWRNKFKVDGKGPGSSTKNLNYHYKYTDEDAGNYEGALVFTKTDYQEPLYIRDTLKSGKVDPTHTSTGFVYERRYGHIKNTIPSRCEALFMRLGMVTNWCFEFFQEMDLNGYCDGSMSFSDLAGRTSEKIEVAS